MMSTSDTICNLNDDASNNNDVCEVNDMLQNMNMSTADNKDVIVSVCANCGKEGSDVNNTCNKCKQVKYCNAACKKKHRHKHKKDCEEHQRLAAEIHDKELFKQPASHEDCPICFLRIPLFLTGYRYQTCCGKVICSGCYYAPVYDDQGNEIDDKKCPFCRTPTSVTEEEAIEREKIRAEVGDPMAIFNQGCSYFKGKSGFPQNRVKALELWHRAGELTYSRAYCTIGYSYEQGEGVERDEKKALYYYELAAMAGCEVARHTLGNREKDKGNFERALKHHMIATEGGQGISLREITNLYSAGHATKDDYTKALQAFQVYLSEIKSDQRDKAAAANESYRYY